MDTLWRNRLLMIVVDGLAGMGAAGLNQGIGLPEAVVAIAAVVIVGLVSVPLKQPIRAHVVLSFCFFCLGIAIIHPQ